MVAIKEKSNGDHNVAATQSLATIDEALDHTMFGKFNYLVILLSGLVLINVVYESLGISFVLPILECDLGLSYEQQGLLSTACFMGIIVSSPFWGFLADTTGRKRIMQPALLFNFAITVISSFSDSFVVLAMLRFINGIFLSAGSATVFAYVGEFHSQRHRNRAILAAAVISAFSAIFFPLVAWLSINQPLAVPIEFLGIVYKSWRFHLVACGIPGFLCGLLLCCLPESPKYLLTAGRAEEALHVLQHIHRCNTTRNSIYQVSGLLPDLDTPARMTHEKQSKNVFVVVGTSVWQQTAPLFMRHHLKHTFLVSLIQFLIYFTAHGIYMWFPYILNSVMQYTRVTDEPMCVCDVLALQQDNSTDVNDEVQQEIEDCVTNLDIGTYQHTIILEMIYCILLIFVGYATGKIGRKIVLLLICLSTGICGILSVLIALPLLAIYMFMIFLCCALGTTVVNSITVDIFPTNLRAMAVCVSLMLGRIGSVVGSNVLGMLIDQNCEEALFTGAAILMLAGFLGMLLPNTNERSKTPKAHANSI